MSAPNSLHATPEKRGSQDFKRQASFASGASDRGNGEVLGEVWTYKECANNDLVVKRKLFLYNGRFETFHDYERDRSDKKTWHFSRESVIYPRNPQSMKCTKRVIRPTGTWSITATVKGVGEPICLVRQHGDGLNN